MGMTRRRVHGATVPCHCGCGTLVSAYTRNGSPRRYAVGHHARKPAPQQHREKVIVWLTPEQGAAARALAADPKKSLSKLFRERVFGEGA